MNVDYETMRLNDGLYDGICAESRYKRILASYNGVVYYVGWEYCNIHDNTFNKPQYSFVRVDNVPQKAIDLHNKLNPPTKQSDQVKALGEFLCSKFKIDAHPTIVKLTIVNYFLDNNLKVEKR